VRLIDDEQVDTCTIAQRIRQKVKPFLRENENEL
jgi:hypothetical protein